MLHQLHNLSGTNVGCSLYIGLCIDRHVEGQVLAKLRYLFSEVEEQK